MSKVIRICASFTLSKDGFGYWVGQIRRTLADTTARLRVAPDP